MINNSNLNEEKTKNKDLKGIAFISVGILTVIVAIAGATYAYFAVTATNNNVIKGDSAYVSNALTLAVTEKTSTGAKKLIPQKDQAIQNAVTAGCKDANNNYICKVFEIKITNTTTTQFYVDGTLTFNASTIPNLKWAKGTTATTGFPSSTTGPFYAPSNTHVITAGTTANYSTLATDIVLGPKDSANDESNIYIVVWISETNASQTDTGSFTGTVSFTGSNAAGTSTGITSTITS